MSVEVWFNGCSLNQLGKGALMKKVFELILSFGADCIWGEEE